MVPSVPSTSSVLPSWLLPKPESHENRISSECSSVTFMVSGTSRPSFHRYTPPTMFAVCGIFLRKVEPGKADRSYGIEVARLAGLPLRVIERASEVLRLHERTEHVVTEELSTAPAQPVQIQLFEPLNYGIAERIRNLNIDELRPVEALRLLAELQDELRRACV